MRYNIFFIILMVISAFGQDVATLTEADAVKMALAHHPSLAAEQADANMASARTIAMQSEGKLQFSANGQTTFSTMNNVLAAPVLPLALLQSQGRASLGINGTAMLPIYTGGRIQSNINSGKFAANAAKQEVAMVRTQVAYNARVRFSDWIQALAMLNIVNDTLTAQTKNTLVIQQLFDVGKVPRFDLLRAQAETANAHQLVTNSQADVIVARAMLAQALGVTVDTIPTSPAINETTINIEKSLETALKKRPDLLASGLNISAAKSALSALNGNYHPQVYAVGMIDATAPRNMGKSAGFTIGLIAGIPILDGGRRKAETNEVEQAITKANANHDVIELQVRADVASTEARVNAAKQNIDTATTQVTAATEAYTVAEARYAAGKGTIVELLDVQRSRTEARQSLVIANAQYKATVAALYLAMGIDVVEKDK
jgi:outer membrane protein